MGNNTSPQLSVIIPAYRAHDHLHISVESLLGQSFKNFEIIIVEDCSGDGGATLAEAHRLATTDARIRIGQTAVNSGCGPSRNVGLDMAKGKYVTFLDADDTLAPGSLEQLNDMACRYDADIVCFSMEAVLPSGKVLAHVENAKETFYTDPSEITEIALNVFSESVGKGRRPYRLHTISRLIRLSLLNDNNIRFPSTPHLLSEDMPFVYAGMRKARNLVISPNTYYRYLQRPGSITHSPRPDMIERAVESAKVFISLIESDKDAPSHGIDNAMGYALTGVRAYSKLMFTSTGSLGYKLKWIRSQADNPFFKTIYNEYPWREMNMRQRLSFWAFYHKHAWLLYMLVTGLEKVRSIMKKSRNI